MYMPLPPLYPNGTRPPQKEERSACGAATPQFMAPKRLGSTDGIYQFTDAATSCPTHAHAGHARVKTQCIAPPSLERAALSQHAGQHAAHTQLAAAGCHSTLSVLRTMCVYVGVTNAEGWGTEGLLLLVGCCCTARG